MRARERLAKNLRAYATKRGLSQNEFARLLGMQQTTVNRLFRANHAATLDTVDDLATAMGLDISDLLRSEGAEDGNKQSVSRGLAVELSHLLDHYLSLPDAERSLLLHQAKRLGKANSGNT